MTHYVAPIQCVCLHRPRLGWTPSTLVDAIMPNKIMMSRVVMTKTQVGTSNENHDHPELSKIMNPTVRQEMVYVVMST